MPAPESVLQLIERFDRNKDAYRSGQYNETQVRREFIDPFFKALGWDIDNEQGWAEAYKDVVHEDAIKVGGFTKAPDYCFRIGGSRKFFVEAKKPSVNVKEDLDPAFQVRRYAWSAKLPLSIVTDFEELAVYDCRVKPQKTDTASVARVLYLRYADYPAQWDSIADIFSRESVLRGSFDKYAESTKAKRGTTEVDAAFLKEIESWREKLAQNIALRNPRLTQRELNYAVQVTIDRLIFLRICEDRGIEDYKTLIALLGSPQVYGRLLQLFERADQKYNSGLFHFHDERDRAEPPDELTPKLTIDDKPLKEIIGRLYYPDCPYEFAVLPADILGQVYEQFLGQVIRLTASHRAVVEDKPEVKKAGGVFYTPTYIVDYIVKQTVGKLTEGKKPKDVGKLRILDPACGSGSFLIGAYDHLLNWHRDWYVNAGPEKFSKQIYQGPGGVWHLTTAEKKRILLNNIYGVDIDPQAVEVTKLSLLLKVLEGESQESLMKQLSFLRERALPDLSANIKCGNSLIGPDYYENVQMSFLDEEERYRINVFDWQASFPEIFAGAKPGFDAVIGNPPYDVMEKDRGKTSWPHDSLSEYVRIRDDYDAALGGKLNLFRFFIIKGLALTRPNGLFGMIVPLALLADLSCARTRLHLIQMTAELLADCFPQKDNVKRRVFRGAKLSTVVITGKRVISEKLDDKKIDVRVFKWNMFDDDFKQSEILLSEAKRLDPENIPIPLVDIKEWDICKRTHSARDVRRLGEVSDYLISRGEINQTIYRNFISDNPSMMRLVKGVEVGPFEIRSKLSQGKQEWFDEKKFLASAKPKRIIEKRRIAIQRITGIDEDRRIVATIVDPPAYFADSTNSIVAAGKYDLAYLLALLNSRLFQWRFKLTSTNNNVATNELASLPFRLIDFSDSKDRDFYQQLLRLSNQLLQFHERLSNIKTSHEKIILQNQIDVVDRQINALVYELYGLTEDEIKVVEGATGAHAPAAG